MSDSEGVHRTGVRRRKGVDRFSPEDPRRNEQGMVTRLVGFTAVKSMKQLRSMEKGDLEVQVAPSKLVDYDASSASSSKTEVIEILSSQITDEKVLPRRNDGVEDQSQRDELVRQFVIDPITNDERHSTAGNPSVLLQDFLSSPLCRERANQRNVTWGKVKGWGVWPVQRLVDRQMDGVKKNLRENQCFVIFFGTREVGNAPRQQKNAKDSFGSAVLSYNLPENLLALNIPPLLLLSLSRAVFLIFSTTG